MPNICKEFLLLTGLQNPVVIMIMKSQLTNSNGYYRRQSCWTKQSMSLHFALMQQINMIPNINLTCMWSIVDWTFAYRG